MRSLLEMQNNVSMLLIKNSTKILESFMKLDTDSSKKLFDDTDCDGVILVAIIPPAAIGLSRLPATEWSLFDPLFLLNLDTGDIDTIDAIDADSSLHNDGVQTMARFDTVIEL